MFSVAYFFKNVLLDEAHIFGNLLKKKIIENYIQKLVPRFAKNLCDSSYRHTTENWHFRVYSTDKKEHLKGNAYKMKFQHKGAAKKG